MKTKNSTSVIPNNAFIRILGIPALVLVIPFILRFNWDETDYLAIGILLIGAIGLLELAMRLKGKSRVYFIAAIIVGALWLYVELAVGLFTNWGS